MQETRTWSMTFHCKCVFTQSCKHHVEHSKRFLHYSRSIKQCVYTSLGQSCIHHVEHTKRSLQYSAHYSQSLTTTYDMHYTSPLLSQRVYNQQFNTNVANISNSATGMPHSVHEQVQCCSRRQTQEEVLASSRKISNVWRAGECVGNLLSCFKPSELNEAITSLSEGL